MDTYGHENPNTMHGLVGATPTNLADTLANAVARYAGAVKHQQETKRQLDAVSDAYMNTLKELSEAQRCLDVELEKHRNNAPDNSYWSPNASNPNVPTTAR